MDNFVTARENSIEVYDDQFGRYSILTRSARMRKFKFYQYKPIVPDSTPKSPSSSDQNVTNNGNSNLTPRKSRTLDYNDVSPLFAESSEPAFLVPRDEVLQGKVALGVEQSKELSEVQNEIVALEKKIADLKSDGNNANQSADKLDEIFELVNKKNDLLRRQMQLNILEQEKVLEKATEELTKELRSLTSIDDSNKTHAQLDRQQYLSDQLLELVNRRNELVLHMDVQEKGIDDDNELRAHLKTVISNPSTRDRLNGQDQNCCIQ